MAEVRISAEPRSEFGKGFARRTRAAGKVPAVLYGHGESPRHFALPARDLMHAFRGDAGANVLLRVEWDGGSELALPRQIQRDPLRGDFTHVDLLLVRRGEMVAVDVPLSLVGEAIGVKNDGGVLDQPLTALSIECDATAIPQQFEVDVSALAIGDHITAGQIKVPDDVTLLTDPDTYVVHVMAPTVEAEPEVVEGLEGAEPGAAPAEGDEAPAEASADSE